MNLEYSRTAFIYALFMSIFAQPLYRRAGRERDFFGGTLVTAVASTCNKLQGSFKRNPSFVLHVTAINPTPCQIRKPSCRFYSSPPPPLPDDFLPGELSKRLWLYEHGNSQSSDYPVSARSCDVTTPSRFGFREPLHLPTCSRRGRRLTHTSLILSTCPLSLAVTSRPLRQLQDTTCLASSHWTYPLLPPHAPPLPTPAMVTST
jgi:hypothetical protein